MQLYPPTFQIGMNISNLPEFPDQANPYYCIFGDDKTQYPAKVALISGLSCQTPPINRIPALVEKGKNVSC
jgi:hypothetical protein